MRIQTSLFIFIFPVASITARKRQITLLLMLPDLQLGLRNLKRAARRPSRREQLERSQGSERWDELQQSVLYSVLRG